jgi:hypothetical protein
MTDMPDPARARLRQTAYALLIVTSAAAMAGRVLHVASEDGRTPFLSANDRSRWCTIRALVDDGTFVIDDVIIKDPQATRFNDKFDKAWYAIDMVRHRGADGREHYYSSKPPLLPLLLAGPYWVIERTTGAKLEYNAFYVGRITLLLTHVLPLVFYFWLFARLVECYGTTDWGRMFAVACATWGTFLSTFAVTLNNHLPAAISVLCAIYAALAVWRDERREWYYFAAAGFFSAFAATNELPALSFAVAVAAAMAWKSPLRTALAFVPAAAVVAAAFFATNYWAHQTWIPAYAHRGKDGPTIATLKVSQESSLVSDLERGVAAEQLRDEIQEQAGVELSERTTVTPKEDGRWMLWDEDGHNRLAVVHVEGRLDVHAWDDWYDYEFSYWTGDKKTGGKKTGVDLGEDSRLVYALHTTIGHHGILSLTPIWLLSIAGVVLMFLRRELRFRGFALLVVLLTLVCLAFYISRPLEDRNYGGVSTGLRWMFWFAPLWLICLLPAADAIADRRLLRWLALLLLFSSVASAAYGWTNPWTHPWFFDYWVAQGFPAPGG